MKGTISLLLISGILGQSTPQFEVAVIRPNLTGPATGTIFNVFEGGRVSIVNEPVNLLIRVAFQLQNAQIAGAPAWLDSDRYDLEAKTGRKEKPGPDDIAPLMQNLLADRFHLTFHREMRELAVWALVSEKNQRGESKLKKSEAERAAMNTHGRTGNSQLVGVAVSMDALARYVGNRLGRIVVDKTGLTDTYDFTLEWSQDEAANSPAPSLVTALHEQLGLKLESRKSPVGVLVIDGIQKPSEN